MQWPQQLLIWADRLQKRGEWTGWVFTALLSHLWLLHKPSSIALVFVMVMYFLPAVNYLEMSSNSLMTCLHTFLLTVFFFLYTAILYLSFTFYVVMFSEGSFMHSLPSHLTQSTCHYLKFQKFNFFLLLNCLWDYKDLEGRMYTQRTQNSEHIVDAPQTFAK